jgi:hypothetical protein
MAASKVYRWASPVALQFAEPSEPVRNSAASPRGFLLQTNVALRAFALSVVRTSQRATIGRLEYVTSRSELHSCAF